MVVQKNTEEIIVNLTELQRVSNKIKEQIIKINGSETEISFDIITKLSNALSRMNLSDTSLETLKKNHDFIKKELDDIILLVNEELDYFGKNNEVNEKNKESLKRIYQIWVNLGQLLGKDLKYLTAEIAVENNLIKNIKNYENKIKSLSKDNEELINGLNKFITEKSNGNLNDLSSYIYFEYLIIEAFNNNKNNLKKGEDYKKKIEVGIKAFDALIQNELRGVNGNYLYSLILNIFKSNEIFENIFNDTDNIFFIPPKNFKGELYFYDLNNNDIGFQSLGNYGYKSQEYKNLKNGFKIGIRTKFDEMFETVEVNPKDLNKKIEIDQKGNLFIDVKKLIDNSTNNTVNTNTNTTNTNTINTNYYNSNYSNNNTNNKK